MRTKLDGCAEAETEGCIGTGPLVRRGLLLCLALLAAAPACQVTYSISGTITRSSVGSGTVLTLSGLSTGSVMVAADSSGNYQFLAQRSHG